MNPPSVVPCEHCREPVVLARTRRRIVVLRGRPTVSGSWFEDCRKSKGPVVVRKLEPGSRFPVFSRFWAEHRCFGGG